jgi:hypothetical protein
MFAAGTYSFRNEAKDFSNSERMLIGCKPVWSNTLLSPLLHAGGRNVSLPLHERTSRWLRLDWLGDWFRRKQNTGTGICPFCTASRPPVRPTRPLIKWLPGTLFWGLKRPVRKANHSPLFSFKFRNHGAMFLLCRTSSCLYVLLGIWKMLPQPHHFRLPSYTENSIMEWCVSFCVSGNNTVLKGNILTPHFKTIIFYLNWHM